MKRHFWLFFLTLLFPLATYANPNPKPKPKTYECIEEVSPEPRAISTNIAFVIDASSSMNRSQDVSAEFTLAWRTVTNLLGQDQIFATTYVFHDENNEAVRPWEPVNEPKQFQHIETWFRAHTGIYSWGQKSLISAIKNINPLAQNPSEKARMTIFLITDGGFTEAARANTTGWHYQGLEEAIAEAQKWRVDNGLEPATIVSIGLENLDVWSLGVKRPDDECQQFLKKIGMQYKGGYFHVKEKKPKRVS